MNLIKKLKTSFEIVISNDNRFLCHTMGSKTIVYDTNNWEKVIELPKPKNPGYIKFSRNDDFFTLKIPQVPLVCIILLIFNYLKLFNLENCTKLLRQTSQ